MNLWRIIFFQTSQNWSSQSCRDVSHLHYGPDIEQLLTIQNLDYSAHQSQFDRQLFARMDVELARLVEVMRSKIHSVTCAYCCNGHGWKLPRILIEYTSTFIAVHPSNISCYFPCSSKIYCFALILWWFIDLENKIESFSRLHFKGNVTSWVILNIRINWLYGLFSLWQLR